MKFTKNINSSPIQPAQRSRIVSLDIIRGVAVCAILVMNIINFSLSFAAYVSPVAETETGINYLLFCLQHIFVDQKAMAIFSMLFGAGAMIFIENQRQKVGHHHRFFWRMFWLFMIGLAHTCFTNADILTIYAVVGLFLPIFWQLSVVRLTWIAIIALVIAGLQTFFWLLASDEIPSFSQEAFEYLYTEGDYSEETEDILGAAFIIDGVLRAFAMMLLGMALYKSGFIVGKQATADYRRTAIRFGLIGLAFALVSLAIGIYTDFDAATLLLDGRIPNLIATPFMAIAYIALLHLWLQASSHNQLMRLKQGFAAMGRMALTNYLLQTFIMLALFTAWGANLYGTLDRWAILLVVVAIWVVQMTLSVLWLRHFRFGPVEHVWRLLTYGRMHLS